MLADLLNRLSEMAVKASGPHVREVDNGKTQLVVLPDGHEYRPVPVHRNHTFTTLDSVMDAIERWCQGGTVWHNDGAIVVVFDDTPGGQWDAGTLALSHSPQFNTLAKTPEAMDHRRFIRFLRHDLANTGVEHLLSIVRRVEFKRQNDGRSDLSHGKESLGRSVESAVTGTADIPEQVTVSIPIYDTPGCNATESVACSLDVDPGTERFMFVPLPGELQAAIQRVQERIHDSLKEVVPDSVDVFYGSHS